MNDLPIGVGKCLKKVESSKRFTVLGYFFKSKNSIFFIEMGPAVLPIGKSTTQWKRSFKKQVCLSALCDTKLQLNLEF